mmetsp:Transcript_5226/g.16596  ORF Transcript_5226/g.16596 Transcript_5226/m.16596 type:complete len:215 (+) Transcript_5226:204-848(+)
MTTWTARRCSLPASCSSRPTWTRNTSAATCRRACRRPMGLRRAAVAFCRMETNTMSRRRPRGRLPTTPWTRARCNGISSACGTRCLTAPFRHTRSCARKALSIRPTQLPCSRHPSVSPTTQGWPRRLMKRTTMPMAVTASHRKESRGNAASAWIASSVSGTRPSSCLRVPGTELLTLPQLTKTRTRCRWLARRTRKLPSLHRPHSTQCSLAAAS